MILAAGLTPAWQQILVFDHVVTGEVNRASAAHWCASGKVLNVGVALKHLGAAARLVWAGGGWSSTAIQGQLNLLAVHHRWIETTHPTRVCTTIIDNGGHSTTEFVENSAELSFEELAAFQQAYLDEAASAEIVVLSGSLPHKTPSTYYRDLVSRTPGRVILDVRGPELIEALATQPFIIKPNRAELSKTMGLNLSDDQALISAMRDLNSRGARWVIITDGPRPVWVSSASQIWKVHPPLIHVVNPIGSGDALAAGLAAALDAGQDVLEAVRFGVAAAADNATQLLPCRLDPQRMAKLLTQVALTTAVI